MTEHAIAAIVVAIEHNQCLRIVYEPGERVIEPHALGRGTDAQLLLRAYQIDGATASGESMGWKLFRLDKVSSIEPDGSPSTAPRPDYKRNDRAMKGGIIAEV
jgi:hypothetical protein